MTNEELDLELFKACYPNTNRARIPRTFSFVDPVYGIINCFSVLIPEMNRRGWYYTVSYDPSFQCHEAMFWNEDAQDFKATDDNNVAEAISKAAYVALKGETK